eukprot:CCRYP_016687-RA/>CCRYP_016687-RA protein AED:0.34 eAED:0.48 QI:756/0.66/0.75/1/0/0/4/0/71
MLFAHVTSRPEATCALRTQNVIDWHSSGVVDDETTQSIRHSLSSSAVFNNSVETRAVIELASLTQHAQLGI